MSGLWAGAAAGAAGAAALNIATYTDMAVRADWLSDVVPHLVYGAVTYATLRALDR